MTETIEIGNVRDYWDGEKMQLPEHAVYVGRRNNRRGLRASPLENPFTIGSQLDILASDKKRGTVWFERRERATRADTINAYKHFRLGPAMRLEKHGVNEELARLRALHAKHGKLLLLCWCHPKPCHAEEIKRVLEAGE